MKLPAKRWLQRGSRHVSPGIDPIVAQSTISLALMPRLMPLLQRLEPFFHDFGFIELHSCRVGQGPNGATFVRRLADSLQAPVRAALSRQEAALVFTLTGPTFNGIPGGISLRDWGVFPRRRSPQYDWTTFTSAVIGTAGPPDLDGLASAVS